jgi:hypothetical protein
VEQVWLHLLQLGYRFLDVLFQFDPQLLCSVGVDMQPGSVNSI